MATRGVSISADLPRLRTLPMGGGIRGDGILSWLSINPVAVIHEGAVGEEEGGGGIGHHNDATPHCLLRG